MGKKARKKYPEINSAISGYRTGQHIIFFQTSSAKKY
jgi:hypothetical protein